jgi:hypothetical protein
LKIRNWIIDFRTRLTRQRMQKPRFFEDHSYEFISAFADIVDSEYTAKDARMYPTVDLEIEATLTKLPELRILKPSMVNILSNKRRQLGLEG